MAERSSDNLSQLGDLNSGTPVPAAVEDIAPSLLGPISVNNDDADSAYGESVATDTTSLLSSIARYREENGRTYHSYGSTEHWGPNDDRAQDQQDLSHQLWTLSLKGRLFLAPVKRVEEVLDIGTGTGIWAIEVAEQWPSANVMGTDLSPIQPTWVPPNCFFEVDDYNLDWIDEEKYDLVHARELLGTCPDWVELYRRALRSLKPGGWFEQHEPSLFFVSDTVELSDEAPFRQWAKIMTEAGNRAGLQFDIAERIKDRMEQAGFVNVRQHRMPWLVGGWSTDDHQREVGQWNQLRLDMGIADFCSRRFHNHLGVGRAWKVAAFEQGPDPREQFTPEAIEVFCANLRTAFRDRALNGYQWAYFVYGQRPKE